MPAQNHRCTTDPIHLENMSLVVNHISDTLDTVIGNGYYKDVFTGFENLSHLF